MSTPPVKPVKWWQLVLGAGPVVGLLILLGWNAFHSTADHSAQPLGNYDLTTPAPPYVPSPHFVVLSTKWFCAHGIMYGPGNSIFRGANCTAYVIVRNDGDPGYGTATLGYGSVSRESAPVNTCVAIIGYVEHGQSVEVSCVVSGWTDEGPTPPHAVATP
jgi:hypothetical protein